MLIDCTYCNGSGKMIDKIVYAKNEETGFEVASEPFETDCIACDGSGKLDVPDDYKVYIETQDWYGTKFVITYDQDYTYYATATYRGVEFTAGSGQPDYAVDECFKKIYAQFPPDPVEEEDIPF